MRNFRQIIFMFAMVMGLALSVPANSDDQKKPPKNPPVVDPGKKPPRGNPPRDDKPKKPGMSFYLVTVKGANNLG